jgi:hypothetical protein
MLKKEGILENVMKKPRSSTVLSLTLVSFLLAGSAAKADTFSFAIDSSLQYAVAGDTLAFDASVTNLDPTATVWLNSAQITSLDSRLTGDTTPFFSSFPFFLDPLAPGPSYTYDGEMFDITVPLGTTPGVYAGEVQILGGSDESASDILGDEVFSVDVTGDTTSVVPEPSSLVLLLTGMTGLAAFRRRMSE